MVPIWWLKIIYQEVWPFLLNKHDDVGVVLRDCLVDGTFSFV